MIVILKRRMKEREARKLVRKCICVDINTPPRTHPTPRIHPTPHKHPHPHAPPGLNKILCILVQLEEGEGVGQLNARRAYVKRVP
jgi:hypothetical protein